MNLDPNRGLSPEHEGEPIPFSSDFVERVLREADHRRAGSRWRRALAAGAVLAIAFVVAGRGPKQVGNVPLPETGALLAVSDLDPTEVDIAGELAAEDEADGDPDSYFASTPEALTAGQTDEGDNPDDALFGPE